MKHLPMLCVALILSPVAFAAGANIPTSIIPDNVVLCQTNSGCFNKTLFGRSYKALRTPRFTVMVSISKEGKYTRADVSIANNSGLPLNLSPDDFRIEVLSPKSKILTYVSPADLKNIAPSPAIPPIPAESTDPTTTSSPQSPAVSSTKPISIDEIYAESKKEALQDAYDKAVAQQHLAAASIAPNEITRGRVYFERDKHAQVINVVLPVAGLVFEFPYDVGR